MSIERNTMFLLTVLPATHAILNRTFRADSGALDPLPRESRVENTRRITR